MELNKIIGREISKIEARNRCMSFDNFHEINLTADIDASIENIEEETDHYVQFKWSDGHTGIISKSK